MNAILSKFSLSVLLRQFFCGIAFFLPFLLKSGEEVAVPLSKTLGQSGTLGLFVALACVVGTVVHHLEKNIFSYGVQVAIECIWDSKKGTCNYARLIVGGILLFICIGSLPLLILSESFAAFAAICILLVFALLWIMVFKKGIRKMMARTQILWIISESAKSKVTCDSESSQNMQNWDARRAVLKHLDAWSDNIHCVQSCCFAWMGGLCCAREWDNAIESVSISAVILVVEILIEIHRYSHVRSITDNKGQFIDISFIK